MNDGWPAARSNVGLARAAESLRAAIFEYAAFVLGPIALPSPPRRVRFECQRCGRRGVVEVRGVSVYQSVRRAHRVLTRSRCRFQALAVYICPAPPLD